MYYNQKEQPARFGVWTLLNGLLPIPFLVIVSLPSLLADCAVYHMTYAIAYSTLPLAKSTVDLLRAGDLFSSLSDSFRSLLVSSL